jgi:hypothetical protein
VYHLARASVALANGDAEAAIHYAKIALDADSGRVTWKIDRIETHLLLMRAYTAIGDAENAAREHHIAIEITQNWVTSDSDYKRYVASFKPDKLQSVGP